MPRTKFAEIISRRRKELGLSLPQAAKALRMRESVLEAFEDGDFERLPALGYAQGMISSYARYLGLDARQIAELYEREHEEFVRERTGHNPSGLARLSDEPGYHTNSTSVIPVRQPGSQGSSRPTPLAGTGRAGSYGSGGYASSAYASRDAAGAGERRYTTRVPSDPDARARRQQAASARRSRGAEGGGRYRGAEASRYPGDDITTRRVSSGQYRDDMRYDDGARPYRSSATRAGREAARNVASPTRPNVRRRRPPSQGRDPRDRGRLPPRRRAGLAGVLDALLADPSRAIMLGALVLAVVLGAILVVSIRSCAAGPQEQKQVSVVTAATSASTPATTTSAAEQQALSAAAEKQAALSAAAASQETKVSVSVSQGSTTWVEVTSDGMQKVADNITGSWSEEYTVTKSISIQVGDPSVVEVTKNGERVQLSSKTGGIASVTIQGTDPNAATASTTDAAATSSAKTGSSSSSSGKSSSD